MVEFTSDIIAFAFAGAVALAGTAVAAQANAIGEEPKIHGKLLSAAIGDVLVKKCEKIEPRRMRVIFEAWKLQNYALGLGFEQDEIDRFIHDKAEQKRFLDEANAYLRAQGAVEGDNETYCDVGRQEVATGTLTGWLIKVK